MKARDRLQLRRLRLRVHRDLDVVRRNLEALEAVAELSPNDPDVIRLVRQGRDLVAEGEAVLARLR